MGRVCARVAAHVERAWCGPEVWTTEDLLVHVPTNVAEVFRYERYYEFRAVFEGGGKGYAEAVSLFFSGGIGRG
jgi:hypothetical protein